MKDTKTAKMNLFLPVFGLLCGMINGLLGAGAGILLVFFLRKTLSNREHEEQDVFANALCVTLPLTACSALFYAIRGDFNLTGIGPYLLPSVLGGLLGGYLLIRLPTHHLKRIFAILIVCSGILMLVR